MDVCFTCHLSSLSIGRERNRADAATRRLPEQTDPSSVNHGWVHGTCIIWWLMVIVDSGTALEGTSRRTNSGHTQIGCNNSAAVIGSLKWWPLPALTTCFKLASWLGPRSEIESKQPSKEQTAFPWTPRQVGSGHWIARSWWTSVVHFLSLQDTPLRSSFSGTRGGLERRSSDVDDNDFECKLRCDEVTSRACQFR